MFVCNRCVSQSIIYMWFRNCFLLWNCEKYGEPEHRKYLSILTTVDHVHVQMSQWIAIRLNKHYSTAAAGENSAKSIFHCGNCEHNPTYFRERQSKFPSGHQPNRWEEKIFVHRQAVEYMPTSVLRLQFSSSQNWDFNWFPLLFNWITIRIYSTYYFIHEKTVCLTIDTQNTHVTDVIRTTEWKIRSNR